MNEASMLLRTPEMYLVCWPFQGPGKDQWIGKILVTSNTGDHVVEVEIRKDLIAFDRTKAEVNAFETLNVIVGPSASPSRLTHIPGHDVQLDNQQGLILKFVRIQGVKCLQARFLPCREGIIILGKHAKVLIESVSAVERYGPSVEAFENNHLDVQVV